MASRSESNKLLTHLDNFQRHTAQTMLSLKQAINPMSEDELDEELSETYPPSEPHFADRKTEADKWRELQSKQQNVLTRGGKGVDSDGGSSDESDINSHRSEHWFAHTEEQVAQNTKITMKNRTLLNRIDERTALLMRILFAVLLALIVTILGGLAVQLIFI